MGSPFRQKADVARIRGSWIEVGDKIQKPTEHHFPITPDQILPSAENVWKTRYIGVFVRQYTSMLFGVVSFCSAEPNMHRRKGNE